MWVWCLWGFGDDDEARGDWLVKGNFWPGEVWEKLVSMVCSEDQSEADDQKRRMS